MNCRELLEQLNQYVDGDIDPALCEEIERHLADCDPCQVMVDTLRKTITIYKNGRPLELPPGFHKRLHQTLRAHWKQTHRTP